MIDCCCIELPETLITVVLFVVSSLESGASELRLKLNVTKRTFTS